MVALHMALADYVVLTATVFGHHVVVTLSELIYWIIAAIVGLVAEFIVGWRLPFGIIGSFIAALVGIWLMTNIVNLVIPGDPTLYGVPIIKALIGAIIFVALWHLITYRSWGRRTRVA